MGKDTIIPVRFDRELTFKEIEAFVDHVIDFATAMKMEATYISLDAVKKRVEARTSNENSGLHLQRVVPSTLYDCDDCMNYPCVLQEWSSDKGRKLKLNECGDKVVKKLL